MDPSPLGGVDARGDRLVQGSIGVLLLTAFVASGAIAGVNRWTTNGPEGPPAVSRLITDPSNGAVIYAGTSGGVFKSEDGADSWRGVNEGLTDRSISAPLRR